MKFTSFTEMPVWQKSHEMVLDIYMITTSFPVSEIYCTTAQIKRSALSVTGNIAEAFGRFHYLDKNKFYLNARGSLEETKNYLIISRDLDYIEDETFSHLIEEIDDINEALNTMIKTFRLMNQQNLQSQPETQSQYSLERKP